VENSIGGGIVRHARRVPAQFGKICAEVKVDDPPQLLSRESWEQVRESIPKPEVFSQCRKWLSAVARPRPSAAASTSKGGRAGPRSSRASARHRSKLAGQA